MSILNSLTSFALNPTTTNAPKPKTVIEFWNHIINKGGAAKQCRFMVLLEKPRFGGAGNKLQNASDFNVLKDLAFQCETAELPPKNISTYDTIISGPNIKLPYQTVYQDINLTFFCTNDMYERRIFDSWLNFINDDNQFLFAYREDYTTTITIFQYDETNRVTYSIKCFDAYPIAISSMPLVSGEQNIHRLTVTFAYTKWQAYTKSLVIPGLSSFDNLPLSGFGATIGNILSPIRGLVGEVQQAVGEVNNQVIQVRNFANQVAGEVRNELFQGQSFIADIENTINSVYNVRI